MAIRVGISLDDRELRRAARRLTGPEGKKAFAEGLNKTAFEVLDALKAHSAQVFSHAQDRGKRFLSGSGSFRFDAAKPEELQSVIYPNVTSGKHPRRREEILLKHQRGGLFDFASDPTLRLGERVAVPVAVKRTPQGKVPVRYLPSRVLKRKSRRSRGVKGFLAGAGLHLDVGQKAAILERIEGRVRVLYALVPRIRIEPRFDFEGAVRRTAERVHVEKFRRAFEKAAQRIGRSR